MDNVTRRGLLTRHRQSQFPGSILDVFKAYDQGVDLIGEFEQQQMQVAQTPQQQQQGLRPAHQAGNVNQSMAFPNVPPNTPFNTMGMKAPIDIKKFDEQGHLVKSYDNVPPGVQNLPTGPQRGTVIETPANMQAGGVISGMEQYAQYNNLNPELAAAVASRPQNNDRLTSSTDAQMRQFNNRGEQTRVNKAQTNMSNRLSTAGSNAYQFHKDKPLDALGMDLAIAGQLPIIGEVADLANAGISGARGLYNTAVGDTAKAKEQYALAGLSAASAIPFVGNAAGAARLAKTGHKIAHKAHNLEKGVIGAKTFKASAHESKQRGGFKGSDLESAMKVGAGAAVTSTVGRGISALAKNRNLDKDAFAQWKAGQDRAHQALLGMDYDEYCLTGDCPENPFQGDPPNFKDWRNHDYFSASQTNARPVGRLVQGFEDNPLQGKSILKQGVRDGIVTGALTYGTNKLLDNTRFGRKVKRNFNVKVGWNGRRQNGGPRKMQSGGDYNMARAQELGYKPDATGHYPSVDYETGMLLKSKEHPTVKLEFMSQMLSPERKMIANPTGYFGENQLQYVPRKKMQSGGTFPQQGPDGLVFPTTSPDTAQTATPTPPPPPPTPTAPPVREVPRFQDTREWIEREYGPDQFGDTLNLTALDLVSEHRQNIQQPHAVRDTIAYHETGPHQRMQPNAVQITNRGGQGVGRGMYMYDQPSTLTAANRVDDIANYMGLETPSFISNLRESNGTSRADTLSREQQDMLFMGDLIEGPAPGRAYGAGQTDIESLWYRGHNRRPDEQTARREFRESMRGLQEDDLRNYMFQEDRPNYFERQERRHGGAMRKYFKLRK